MRHSPIILALPKGRIQEECLPLLRQANIEPEATFFDKATRRLRFHTNQPELDLIVVRSFDVATFVAFGAAHFGIAGSDVLAEMQYSELYAPLDLGIGHCRLVVAERANLLGKEPQSGWSHLRIATKYPNITRRYFAEKGVQAECIKLNGAMELAPTLGLCRQIVDLVSSGATLQANGLVEVETMLDVTSKLIVNRTALKTQTDQVQRYVTAFQALRYANK
jgi:ATP phosphoribosyltransferase